MDQTTTQPGMDLMEMEAVTDLEVEMGVVMEMEGVEELDQLEE